MIYSKPITSIESKTPAMDVSKDMNYQKWFEYKYEMLCRRFNEFNMNK